MHGHSFDYTDIVSLTEAEYDAKVSIDPKDLKDVTKFTKSDQSDLERIENLLDVARGTLAHLDAYLEYGECPNGHLLTMYDFVFSGLADANHSKSFTLHVFLGNKLIVNRPRQVRCSTCGLLSSKRHQYKCDTSGNPRGYSCSA